MNHNHNIEGSEVGRRDYGIGHAIGFQASLRSRQVVRGAPRQRSLMPLALALIPVVIMLARCAHV